MTSSKKTLVLIDGNAILHRAYHALPPMSTKDGILVNAVYGFTSLLLKIINDIKPDAITVAFDMKGKTFRDDLYPEYKATREKKPQELYDQLNPIKDVLQSMDIPWYEQKGFEADDIIGTLAKKVPKENKDWNVLIATGDLDELQLVDSNVQVYALKKGISDVVIYDEKAVRDRYSLTPIQLIDFKAFKGDPSDNIKGVPGIGEKTATNLIQAFDSVEGVYKELDKKGELKEFSSSINKKIAQGKGDALLAKKLVTIVCDLETDFNLDDSLIQEFNHEKIDTIFREFGFTSLVKRIPGSEKEKEKTQRKLSFIDANNDKGFIKLINKIRTSKSVSVFFERSAQQDMFSKGALFIGFFFDEKNLFSLSCDKSHVDEILHSLKTHNTNLVCFDVKHLFHEFGVSDSHKIQFSDVQILEYVLHAGRNIELERILFEYANYKLDKDRFASKPKSYVVEVAKSLQKAHEALMKEVKKENRISVVEDIEEPLTPVLFEMEKTGVLLDVNELDELRERVDKAINKITKKMHKIAGVEFNISSPQQLKEVLFEKLQIPSEGIKKRKTGLSTAASELEKLRGQHEIIEYIFEYRELTKLKSTYIDALPRLISTDGRLHTTFAQAVTATGRLSSNNPNLQNIPMRTELGREVRSAFIAERGYRLLTLDYSQFELRIVAHLSGDKVLKEIFQKGEDVHTTTAAYIHNIPVEKVTKDIRRTAKEVNFGVLYGMGAFGLAQRTGLSRAEASEFITKYFDKFSGVKGYVDKTIGEAMKHGFAETMFGRRREIPELSSDVVPVRRAGERMAINMPIQGTQADIIKMAMVKIDKEIHKNGKDDIRMLLQVHDELVFEVKSGKEKEWGKRIKKIMEDAVKLTVPVVVDVNFGKNWRDLRELKVC